MMRQAKYYAIVIVETLDIDSTDIDSTDLKQKLITLCITLTA
jgi:hypothetical protein